VMTRGGKASSGLVLMAAVTFSCGGADTAAPPPSPPPRTLAAAELPAETNNLRYFVDSVQPRIMGIEIVGWAFISTAQPSAAGSDIFVVLESGGTERVFTATSVQRTDVAEYFKNPDVQGSGFSVLVPAGALSKGQYRLGLYVKRGQEQGLQFTDKTVTVD